MSSEPRLYDSPLRVRPPITDDDETAYVMMNPGVAHSSLNSSVADDAVAAVSSLEDAPPYSPEHMQPVELANIFSAILPAVVTHVFCHVAAATSAGPRGRSVEVVGDRRSLISVQRCRRFLIDTGLVLPSTDSGSLDSYSSALPNAPWAPDDVTDITPAAADALIARVAESAPHAHRITLDKFSAVVCGLAKRRYGRAVNAAKWKTQQPRHELSQLELHLAHIGCNWALCYYHLVPFIEHCKYDLGEVRCGSISLLCVCVCARVCATASQRTLAPWTARFGLRCVCVCSRALARCWLSRV